MREKIVRLVIVYLKIARKILVHLQISSVIQTPRKFK
jgi:hypothetical protein